MGSNRAPGTMPRGPKPPPVPGCTPCGPVDESCRWGVVTTNSTASVWGTGCIHNIWEAYEANWFNRKWEVICNRSKPTTHWIYKYIQCQTYVFQWDYIYLNLSYPTFALICPNPIKALALFYHTQIDSLVLVFSTLIHSQIGESHSPINPRGSINMPACPPAPHTRWFVTVSRHPTLPNRVRRWNNVNSLQVLLYTSQLRFYC